jgi:hypothetical protein
MRRALALVSLIHLVSCVVPPNSSQRLTEAAMELNTATRFGRMDVALERVGAKAREDFLRRHAEWGTRLRVVDVEFGGFDLVKRDEADVFLDVLWLRSDEATVRATRIAQRWRDDRGRWELVREERKDGATGLLGDTPPVKKDAGEPSGATADPPAGLSLHTRVIRGD